jgi:hypothetical protein
MQFRDVVGNILEKDEPVAFPLSFGQVVPGKIVAADSGLGGGPPAISVAVVFRMEAMPNGMVQGVLAMPTPPVLTA